MKPLSLTLEVSRCDPKRHNIWWWLKHDHKGFNTKETIDQKHVIIYMDRDRQRVSTKVPLTDLIATGKWRKVIFIILRNMRHAHRSSMTYIGEEIGLEITE